MAVSSLSLSFFLFLHSISLAHAANGTFRAELIHRHSPKSPFYDPNATGLHRTMASVQRSLLRAKHIGLTISQPSASSNTSMQSKVIADYGEYLMSFKIGTPAFEVFAIIDTGSDVTWTTCKPCAHCYAQSTPMFDPARSSSYRNIPCDSNLCRSQSTLGCRNGSGCEYLILYADNSSVNGVLATETFTFGTTTGGGSTAMPNMSFMCSHQTGGFFNKRSAGLVGLGRGRHSLISQLGATIERKFSYCFVPITEEGKSSWINFGGGAILPPGKDVVTTPLVQGPYPTAYYFMLLREIDVAGHRIKVPISPLTTLLRDHHHNHHHHHHHHHHHRHRNQVSNIIIDSGTTLTLLFSGVLNKLKSILSEVITLKPVSDLKYSPLGPCFQSNSSGVSEEDHIPDMIFKFDGAEVKLSPLNTFFQMDPGVVCLAMASTDDFQIYGNIAQQNFYVDYDLEKMTLSIARTNCSSA